MNIFEAAKKTTFGYLGVDISLCDSKSRKREIKECRQICHWLLKKHTNHYLTVIDSEIGGKDYTTVIHSVKTVNNLMDTEKEFKKKVEDIERMFKPYLVFVDENEEKFIVIYNIIYVAMKKYGRRMRVIEMNRIMEKDCIELPYRRYCNKQHDDVDMELISILG